MAMPSLPGAPRPPTAPAVGSPLTPGRLPQSIPKLGGPIAPSAPALRPTLVVQIGGSPRKGKATRPGTRSGPKKHLRPGS